MVMTLTFSLDGAPAGASIDPLTGVFSWTPAKPRAPASTPSTWSSPMTAPPVLDDTEEVTLTVLEVNRAPSV